MGKRTYPPITTAIATSLTQPEDFMKTKHDRGIFRSILLVVVAGAWLFLGIDATKGMRTDYTDFNGIVFGDVSIQLENSKKIVPLMDFEVGISANRWRIKLKWPQTENTSYLASDGSSYFCMLTEPQYIVGHPANAAGTVFYEAQILAGMTEVERFLLAAFDLPLPATKGTHLAVVPFVPPRHPGNNSFDAEITRFEQLPRLPSEIVYSFSEKRFRESIDSMEGSGRYFRSGDSESDFISIHEQDPIYRVQETIQSSGFLFMKEASLRHRVVVDNNITSRIMRLQVREVKIATETNIETMPPVLPGSWIHDTRSGTDYVYQAQEPRWLSAHEATIFGTPTEKRDGNQ